MINIISEEEKKLKKYKDSVFIILAIQECFIKHKFLKSKDKDKNKNKDEYDINEENLLELLFGNEIEFNKNIDKNILEFQYKFNNES